MVSAGYRQGVISAAANNIAILYREQGRPRLAERWFKHASASDPLGSALELGKLYRDLLGDPARARACFKESPDRVGHCPRNVMRPGR